MSTAIPGEVWRLTFAEQVQHLGLVEETGNQGDFIGRAYRRSSKNVRGNNPKCEGHASMAEIQSFFGDRIISKGLWPPRSPDVTPPDYFLWGYLKGRVYQNKPRSIDALKANITEEIQAVTADVLARTFQNMACRVQSCLDANGGHFQYML